MTELALACVIGTTVFALWMLRAVRAPRRLHRAY